MNRYLILLATLLLPTASVHATEGGGSNYLPGFYGDFGMAVMPDSGTFFNNFFAAYQDKTSKTGTLLEMPGILHVTDQKILDGQFLVGVYPALLVTKDHTSGNNLDRVGLGDFYFIPGGLNWKWDTLTAMLFEGVVAPTGRFSGGELNTGRNYWTFDHNLLLTWNLPADNEISVAIGYMNNLTNPATHYKTGDEFHFDYTVAHYLQSNIGIGIAGSFYKQVTNDEAPASVALSPALEASTIGPAVMYTPRIKGTDVNLSLKWLREFNVEGRNDQEYLIFKLFVPF